MFGRHCCELTSLLLNTLDIPLQRIVHLLSTDCKSVSCLVLNNFHLGTPDDIFHLIEMCPQISELHVDTCMDGQLKVLSNVFAQFHWVESFKLELHQFVRSSQQLFVTLNDRVSTKWPAFRLPGGTLWKITIELGQGYGIKLVSMVGSTWGQHLREIVIVCRGGPPLPFSWLLMMFRCGCPNLTRLTGNALPKFVDIEVLELLKRCPKLRL